jgi:hypothetical protein
MDHFFKEEDTNLDQPLAEVFPYLLEWEALAHRLFINEKANECADVGSATPCAQLTAAQAHDIACYEVDELLQKKGFAVIKPFLKYMLSNEENPLNPFSLFHYLLLYKIVPQMRADADALFIRNYENVSTLAAHLPKESCKHYKDLVYYIAPAFVGQNKTTGPKMRRYLKHYRKFVGACKAATTTKKPTADEQEPEQEQEPQPQPEPEPTVIANESSTDDDKDPDSAYYEKVIDDVDAPKNDVLEEDDEENDHLNYFSVDFDRGEDTSSNSQPGFLAKCMKWFTG